MCTTIRPKKIGSSFIYLFHLYTSKIEQNQGSFLLFNFLTYELCIYFVRYIHSSTDIFRTLYSWWNCSYISYAMSMAIWSLGPGLPNWIKISRIFQKNKKNWFAFLNIRLYFVITFWKKRKWNEETPIAWSFLHSNDGGTPPHKSWLFI